MSTTSKYVYNAGTAYPGNFGPQAQAPFDARTLVNTYDDLLDGNTWKNAEGKYYIYNGLTVTVQDTGEIYVLKGANIQPGDYSIPTLSASNWVKSGTTYTPGSNIQISDSNEISATDTTYDIAKAPDKELHIEGSDGLMSKEDKAKLDGIPSDAEANVITSIKVNGDELTPLDKSVDITISDYTLPIASTTELGGIKVGEGLHMSEDSSLNASIKSDINAVNYDEINFNSFRNAISEEIDGVRKAKPNLTLYDVVKALLNKVNDELPKVLPDPTLPIVNIITDFSGTTSDQTIEVGLTGTYTLSSTSMVDFTDGYFTSWNVTNGESEDSSFEQPAGCEVTSTSWLKVGEDTGNTRSDSITITALDNGEVTLIPDSDLLEVSGVSCKVKYSASVNDNPETTDDSGYPLCRSSYGNALYEEEGNIPEKETTYQKDGKRITISKAFYRWFKSDYSLNTLTKNPTSLSSGDVLYIPGENKLHGLNTWNITWIYLSSTQTITRDMYKYETVYLSLPSNHSTSKFSTNPPDNAPYAKYTKITLNNNLPTEGMSNITVKIN